jgi:hypothetical protein
MAPALLPQHDPQLVGLAVLIDGMEDLPVEIQDVGLGYHRPLLQGQAPQAGQTKGLAGERALIPPP